MANRQLVPLGLVQLASDPGGSHQEGEQYWNTASKKVRVYDGTTWVDVSSSSGGASKTFAYFLS